MFPTVNCGWWGRRRGGEEKRLQLLRARGSEHVILAHEGYVNSSRYIEL